MARLMVYARPSILVVYDDGLGVQARCCWRGGVGCGVQEVFRPEGGVPPENRGVLRLLSLPRTPLRFSAPDLYGAVQHEW